MVKTNRLLCVLVLMIFAFSLCGCAKIVDTKTEIVEATIVDIDRDPTICTGKVTIPADYDICLQYADIEIWVDISKSEYNRYKDSVGTTMEVKLITTYYDDGTIKRSLDLIEE